MVNVISQRLCRVLSRQATHNQVSAVLYTLNFIGTALPSVRKRIHGGWTFVRLVSLSLFVVLSLGLGVTHVARSSAIQLARLRSSAVSSVDGLLRTFGVPAAEVNSVAFAPDNQTIFTASEDWTAILCDAATEWASVVWSVASQSVHATLTPGDRPNGVAFSPDGTRVAATTDDGTVWMWGITGKSL